MWLIAGLGNPGPEYVKTRHNLGFRVIDVLSSRLKAEIDQRAENFIYSETKINSHSALLIKPLTYMNKSGLAVAEAMNKFPEIDNILIIHDDLDLLPGIIRIRDSGSSGGHKGVQSIIDALGSNEFIRVKIGIGRSDSIPPERYVLEEFSQDEIERMNEAVEMAAQAVLMVVREGVQAAQNVFHRQRE
jgi:PTH1 family peptidyl-tRNA hydrolase